MYRYVIEIDRAAVTKLEQVTLYNEAYSSMVFAPQNFFDRAQDGDLLNRRWLLVNESTGELSYETYGVGLDTCPVQLAEPAAHILGVVNV
jgi:primary-amine oxidase